MRILYHYPLCPFSRRVRVLLSEKKLDYTMKIEHFWEKRTEFMKLNHAMEVPVLVDLNNAHISDSDVIVEYIEEMYTQIPLYPSDPVQKAETRRLSNWFAHKFSVLVTLPIIQEKVFSRMRNKSAIPNSVRIREAKKEIADHMCYIAWLTGRNDWLAGSEFSIADITAATQLSVLDYLGDIYWDDYPEVKMWYMRIKSRPSFHTILTDQIPILAPSMHYGNLDF